MSSTIGSDVYDVAPGLWVWQVEDPDWEPEADYGPLISSACVTSDGETLVIDPRSPSTSGSSVWERLDAAKPSVVVITKPDHVRDLDAFARRYGARAFGPWLFLRDDVPATDMTPIEPGSALPGGLLALYDGRGRGETPVWMPRQRALFFGDTLNAIDGTLRVWATPWHGERVLPALRAMLDLPFEHVIVSHGDPVHTRTDFEKALERPAWGA